MPSVQPIVRKVNNRGFKRLKWHPTNALHWHGDSVASSGLTSEIYGVEVLSEKMVDSASLSLQGSSMYSSNSLYPLTATSNFTCVPVNFRQVSQGEALRQTERDV